jgi:hypothetical protein
MALMHRESESTSTPSNALLPLLGCVLGFSLVSCRQSGGGARTTPDPAIAEYGADQVEAAALAQDERVEQAALERGGQIASKAQQTLAKHLMQAIGEGGFTNALSVCSDKAMPLTEAVAEENLVSLRRITHQPRNPDDAASPEEMDLIRAFQTVIATSGEVPPPVVLDRDADEIRFYSPIVLNNPLCLNCHGSVTSDIQPATLAMIRELYPNDQATGFKFGELRGMWRIVFPRETLLDTPE